jgi:hypothetical protein
VVVKTKVVTEGRRERASERCDYVGKMETKRDLKRGSFGACNIDSDHRKTKHENNRNG